MVPQTLTWPKKLLATLIYVLIRIITFTLRKRVHDPHGILSKHGARQLIFCIWHNRLALALPCYIQWFKPVRPGRKLAALVSASKDGAVVAYLLELFGAQPVRGSSSRRGAQAILELTSQSELGLDIALTPDGPRGPRYRIQEGAIALAQMTSLPVVPIGSHVNWKLQLKSWDRFQIPLPFAVWTMDIGEPLQVPKDLSDDNREQLRRDLESRLLQLTHDDSTHPAR